MIRMVLDAIQFVSALLKPGSLPDSVTGLVREEKLRLIISGDRHLTDLRQYRGIRIVTPAEFLNRLNLTS